MNAEEGQPKPKPKREKEPISGNRIYHSIDRSPEFAFLPYKQAGSLMGLAALGFFIVKGMFGWKVALLYEATLAAVWAALGFIQSQDRTFIPMMLLQLAVKVRPRIDSMTPGRQRVSVK
jgi:type IV secretory pathway VirB3-like protein